MQTKLQGIQVFGVSHLAGKNLLKGAGGIIKVYVTLSAECGLDFTNGCGAIIK